MKTKETEFSPSVRAVTRARRDFERNGGRKCRMRFDDICAFYLHTHFPVVIISKQAGVSPQAMRALIQRYILPLSPWKNGRERRAGQPYESTLVRAEQNEREALQSSAFQRTIRLARKAGYSIDVVRHKHPNGKPYQGVKVSKTRLIINGHMCNVRNITTSHVYSVSANVAVSYAKTFIRSIILRPVEFVIFHVSIRGRKARTFIVPKHVLLSTYFRGNRQGSVAIYFPLRKSNRKDRRKPLVDFFEYEDRWDLLRK